MGSAVATLCEGPKTVHLQSLGNPKNVRFFEKISLFGLHAIHEQLCIRDVQYPSGVRVFMTCLRLVAQWYTGPCA